MGGSNGAREEEDGEQADDEHQQIELNQQGTKLHNVLTVLIVGALDNREYL